MQGTVRAGEACIIEHPTRGVLIDWIVTEGRPRWSWSRPRSAAKRMSESAARDIVRLLEQGGWLSEHGGERQPGIHGAQVRRYGTWAIVADRPRVTSVRPAAPGLDRKGVRP